jgi:hypothetical protein
MLLERSVFLEDFGLVEVLDEPVFEPQQVEDLGRQRRLLEGRDVRLAVLADVHRRDGRGDAGGLGDELECQRRQ